MMAPRMIRTGLDMGRFALPLAAAASVLLASCGGGGDNSVAPSAFPPSSALSNICTLETQRDFVRSFLDETYLWYDEVPAVNPGDYTSVSSYFNALLVKPKDRFSTVLPTNIANALRMAPGGSLMDGNPATRLAATANSVPLSRVVPSPNGRRVGYILFNDHNQGAQDELIAAVAGLQAGGVDDLVLDMRYNTGGFLYVALTAASMVTGPQSQGRIFEQLRYSAKRQADTAASTFLFSSRVQTAEVVYQRDTPLPQLGLPRLYVLSSGQTCSASESIINSLRGIDVEVILVGGTTCGKPYGFHRQDNCGLSFFAIEFQGYNAKNFGDYTSGLAPTCPVADSLTSTLGSATEPLLAAALHHIDTGSCPVPVASRPSQGLPDVLRRNAPSTTSKPWDGRVLR